MKYIEKYDVFIDDDLVVYAYSCSHSRKVRTPGKLFQLKPQVQSCGYLQIERWKNGKRKRIYYHRIIAEAFIPNPENKPTVDHINHNRTDCRISNLRWATYTEQNRNKYPKQRIAA